MREHDEAARSNDPLRLRELARSANLSTRLACARNTVTPDDVLTTLATDTAFDVRGEAREAMRRRGLSTEAVEASTLPTGRLVPEGRVTTLESIPGHEISELIGVVTYLSSNSGWTATAKGTAALGQAMVGLRHDAAALGADAVVGLRAAPFGAHGGVTGGLGGDAVGILLTGTAVRLRPSASGSPA